MAKKGSSDFTLMIATILLVFIGIIMVFSSSFPDAYYKYNNGYFFLIRQLIYSGIGIFIMFIFMSFDYRRLYKMSNLIFIVCILATFLIFSPLAKNINGATRWVDFGSFTFMPSETMKLGAIIFLAKFLAKKKDDIKSFFYGVMPAFLIIGIACGLIIIQKDLSTSAVLGISLFIMLFISGMKMSQLMGLSIIGLGAATIAILIEPFRRERIFAFLDPFKHKDTSGWQVVQSLYALGSGGLFGLGLGQSRQKFFYIPEPYNDFIFAIIGEELGFVGAVTVILLFLLFIWRGIRIALKAKDLFGCLLASGIVSLIAVQSFIHIAVVTSSMPPTGIPLPFVSYGGTSLIVFLAAVGILLNISKTTELDRS